MKILLILSVLLPCLRSTQLIFGYSGGILAWRFNCDNLSPYSVYMINCSFRGTNISPTKNGSLLGKGRRRANVGSYEPVKLKKINPWRTILTKLYKPEAYIVLPTLISCTRRIYLLRNRGIYLLVCLFRYILRLLPFM